MSVTSSRKALAAVCFQLQGVSRSSPPTSRKALAAVCAADIAGHTSHRRSVHGIAGGPAFIAAQTAASALRLVGGKPGLAPYGLVLVWWLVAIGICAAQVKPNNSTARTSQAPIKTWAILGDSKVTSSGVTDALFAKLSETDMVFVEREQLEKVVDEQTFRTLLSGLAAESKRLGQILKADALIILTQANRPKAIEAAPKTDDQVLRLLVCDCRQGLRLGELNVELAPIDQQSALLGQYILDRREQFAGGVRTIVGLSPMACRNIEHDFDHLQKRYYDMLSGQLMTIPGLAMLELEEARTLARELGAGEQAADRLVPVMVECEYRVQLRDSAPHVQFKAQLTSRRSENVESPVLSLDRSGSWLGKDLIDKILAGTGSQPLQLAEQQALLAQRADYLMRLGDLAGAVQCREAFLLAEPTNAQQRTMLIENLLAIYTKPSPSDRRAPPGIKDVITRQVAKGAAQTPGLLDHLSFLIDNRLVDQTTAIDFIGRLDAARPIQGNQAFIMQLWINEAPIKGWVDSWLSANRRFVQRSAANVLDLPEGQTGTPEQKLRQLATWHNVVMGLVGDEIAFKGGAIDGFKYLEQVVTEKIPESLPTSWAAYGTILNYQRSRQHARLMNKDGSLQSIDIQVDEAAMKAWIQRLTNSSHIHLRWYARAVQMFDEQRSAQRKMPEELRQEIEQFMEEINSRPLSQARATNGQPLDAVYARLQTALGQLRTPAEAGSVIISGESPPTPTNEVMAGPLKVEKLELKFPADLWGVKDYIKAAKGADIVVLGQQVGLITAGPTYRTIHQNADRDSSTVWDGQHVWIAERGIGIAQYDLNGQLVRRVTEKEGLPRHDRALALLALKPNELLVYGAVEPDGRCWVAQFSVVADRPHVKIVHEARQPYRPVVNPKDVRLPLNNGDPSMIFQLRSWYACLAPQRQVCIIGRGQNPLAIDLQSGEVKPFLLEPSAANYFGTILARGDNLFVAYGTGVGQYELPAGSLQPKLKRMVVNALSSGTVPLWVDYPPRLMEHAGWIYKSGKFWYRFRENGESLQRLTLPESPKYWQYDMTAESNHFGIVGWSQHSAADLFRITPP